MLLQHAWLAPLVKPATIMEDDEEEEDITGDDAASLGSAGSRGSTDSDERNTVSDKEVAEWVKTALEKRKNGTLGKGRNTEKPPLHAAPLDAMSSPSRENGNGIPSPQPAAGEVAS